MHEQLNRLVLIEFPPYSCLFVSNRLGESEFHDIRCGLWDYRSCCRHVVTLHLQVPAMLQFLLQAPYGHLCVSGPRLAMRGENYFRSGDADLMTCGGAVCVSRGVAVFVAALALLAFLASRGRIEVR